MVLESKKRGNEGRGGRQMRKYFFLTKWKAPLVSHSRANDEHIQYCDKQLHSNLTTVFAFYEGLSS